MCAAELDFPFPKRPVVVLMYDVLVWFAHLFIPNPFVKIFLAIILARIGPFNSREGQES